MATATKRRRATAPHLKPVDGSAPAASAPPGGYLGHIDPRTLLAHPGNLRKDLGDLSELRASIAAQGVLQALTVIPEGGGYRVVAGHRRAAAAAEAADAGEWPPGLPETVPCLVRPDLVGVAVDQVALMLVENDQRTDLKQSERAAGYAQLAAFDLDAGEIARRTGRSSAHVLAALRLHRMDAKAKEHADAGHLTLEDVAALAEFEDDPKAVARILQGAGSSWGIKHRMADERRKRADAARVAELRVELTAAGVKIVGKPKGWPYSCVAALASQLADPDGELLDPEQVRRSTGSRRSSIPSTARRWCR
jgi:ParB/RepB/Spo0J family partition protein